MECRYVRVEGPEIGTFFPPLSLHLLAPLSCPIPSQRLSPHPPAFKKTTGTLMIAFRWEHCPAQRWQRAGAQ